MDIRNIHIQWGANHHFCKLELSLYAGYRVKLIFIFVSDGKIYLIETKEKNKTTSETRMEDNIMKNITTDDILKQMREDKEVLESVFAKKIRTEKIVPRKIITELNVTYGPFKYYIRGWGITIIWDNTCERAGNKMTILW